MALSASLSNNWLWLATGLVIAYIVRFTVKLVRHRRFYRDLPSPDHTLVLGNAKVLGEWVERYPADAHPQAMFTDMARHYEFHGLYYMDIYPFGEPMLFITDPSLVSQIQGFARHPYSSSFLRGLVGTKSIFSTHGAEWAAQRAWFSPAFASAHLLTLVPGMIEETLVFRERLTDLAMSGARFAINDLVLRLAIDVIARSGFDIRLKSQTEQSGIYDSFQSATEWTAGATASMFRKFMSPYMMDWYTRKLDRQLEKVIRRRYAGKAEDDTSKSILDLAIKGYRKDNWNANTVNDDEELMNIALDNAKTFLIGGHDTTASLVTYTLYLLSLHPEYLARVRQEHDQILGAGLEKTLESLKNEPTLLNKLHLTFAVFKETLRLYPVGFTIRKAPAGATLTYQGKEYPAANHMICNLTTAMHRSPEYWDSPDDFNPDRFLDPTQHQATAFLPFEKGPRNCIGQQLSLIEARVIIALTVRFFDFTPKLNANGEKIEGWGGKAYQELKVTAKPKDGIPMEVKLREG